MQNKVNMNKIKLFLIAILLLSISTYSQEKSKTKKKAQTDSYSGATNWSKKETLGTVSGKIKSEANNEPLKYASISLIDMITNKLVEGSITDENG